MTLTAIAIDFDQALNVQALDPTQITLNLQTCFFDFFSQLPEFVFVQILYAAIVWDAELIANFGGSRATYTVNVGECDLRTLSTR
jgi:hypothetical protein